MLPVLVSSLCFMFDLLLIIKIAFGYILPPVESVCTNNVHYGFGHNYKKLSPQIVPYLKV